MAQYKYSIEVYEVHVCKYEVYADSLENATQLVKDGEAGEGYLEYSHTDKIMGGPIRQTLNPKTGTITTSRVMQIIE